MGELSAMLEEMDREQRGSTLTAFANLAQLRIKELEADLDAARAESAAHQAALARQVEAGVLAMAAAKLHWEAHVAEREKNPLAQYMRARADGLAQAAVVERMKAEAADKPAK